MRLSRFFKRQTDPLSDSSQDSPRFPSKLGRFKFRFQDEQGGSIEDSVELFWKDFNEHLLITGGSGSGKTSTVLHQIYEGLVFKACFHSDPLIVQRVQVGGLVIEAKGDFTPKTKILSKRYHREESVIYFGPEHFQSTYDPFGDPEELPLQRAHKIHELIKAASGGREGGDPFWSQASQKLMTNVFVLYDHVFKSGLAIPALSFQYLNLLCMDKQSDFSGESVVRDYYHRIREGFRAVRKTLTEIDDDLRISSLSLKKESRGSTAVFKREEEECSAIQVRLLRIQEKIEEMQRESLEGFDNDRGKSILNEIDSTREQWGRVLPFFSREECHSIRERKNFLFSQIEEIQFVWRELARTLIEKKKKGPLGQLLEHYAGIVERRGECLESDCVYAYFKNEYLNPSNEKTSASISMVVSNALMPFVTAPFNRMFVPGGSFNFRKVIDEGLLVVLDMPSAQYGVAQLLVSLVMKIDFFRTTLNRSRLMNFEGERLVNQERDLIYLCDEFGSVATTGDQTGESSFLDKGREYRCSCILAMQGLPSLLRKLPEQEVEALLQNCGMKIFLRNDDRRTNDYASSALGSEIKVRLNQNQGATEHWMDSQKKWGARSYSSSYERASRFAADQFLSFRIGEGVLRLPARFGEMMVRRVRFDFNPISL